MPSILLVEDDPATREGLAILLGSHGYVVRCAEDGQQALDWLEAGETPRLLLVDLMLPKVNGSDLLRYMHEQPTLRTVPAIVMTAMPREQVHALADEVLSKPLEIPQLLRSISRLMTSRRPH